MANKVFFLGAGFSKAVRSCYPLMDELTQQVFERLEKESVRKHLDEIPPLVKQNIESLLTYLSTDSPWKTDATKYENKALYSAIVEILSDIFLELAKREQSGVYGPYDIGGNLAIKISKHLEDYNFITLNYDLLLEQMLLRIIREETGYDGISHQNFYSYPMSWIGSRSHSGSFGFASYEKETTLPKILKLHGSVNWFWAGTGPSDILYYRNWTRNEKDNITMGLKPYIIPPVLDKSSFYNHIAIHEIWRQAEELLSNADEIYIVGFSFPQTDSSVKYLFQSALRKHQPKIYVVNADTKKHLQINYKPVFGDIPIDYTYTSTSKKHPDKKVLDRFAHGVMHVPKASLCVDK